MCAWGTERIVNVTIPADLSHSGEAYKRAVGIDACIADLVEAMESAGLFMRSSCCGHGTQDGRIELQDGRVLVLETSQKVGIEMTPDRPDETLAPLTQETIDLWMHGAVNLNYAPAYRLIQALRYVEQERRRSAEKDATIAQLTRDMAECGTRLGEEIGAHAEKDAKLAAAEGDARVIMANVVPLLDEIDIHDERVNLMAAELAEQSATLARLEQEREGFRLECLALHDSGKSDNESYILSRNELKQRIARLTEALTTACEHSWMSIDVHPPYVTCQNCGVNLRDVAPGPTTETT
jgi:hypothetical protein